MDAGALHPYAAGLRGLGPEGVAVVALFVLLTVVMIVLVGRLLVGLVRERRRPEAPGSRAAAPAADGGERRGAPVLLPLAPAAAYAGDFGLGAVGQALGGLMVLVAVAVVALVALALGLVGVALFARSRRRRRTAPRSATAREGV